MTSTLDALTWLVKQVRIPQLWQRPRELGDFKGVDYFEANF